MKKALLLTGLICGICIGLYWGSHQGNRWQGIDETVVEKFAADAGRKPLPPVIDAGRGDLLLFLFLLAGAIGGFVGGYYYRDVFPLSTIKKPRP